MATIPCPQCGAVYPTGQNYSPSLNYVPLPQTVQLQSAQTLDTITVGK